MHVLVFRVSAKLTRLRKAIFFKDLVSGRGAGGLTRPRPVLGPKWAQVVVLPTRSVIVVVPDIEGRCATGLAYPSARTGESAVP